LQIQVASPHCRFSIASLLHAGVFVRGGAAATAASANLVSRQLTR